MIPKVAVPGRSVIAALMKEGVLSIVVLILLIALVWFGGEFLKTPENDLFKERIAIIAVLIGIWVALFIAQKVMAIRSAVRIENQLKAQSGSQLVGADADRKSEIEALGKKFAESLEALKKTKGGKSALFTLPWYVIIGPPGSGKTTALQESGLNFPAVQGGAKVRGIGGTRNCDWWFTEDGILLDTAGRYTTVAEDQEEWFSFLDMIRTSRKQKPINGAIVAIAVDELHRATQGELDQIAKDVRNRLDELAARLQAVFPVYMMFTKCDLINGFVEYFEDFNKEQRGQVWGFTMPYALPDKQYTDIFSDQVARMGANIEARQLELLGSERPPLKKQNIFLFPRQFALATGKMKEFLGSLFQANAFQESAMLRGIYFTSGTQKGTPIDQILARMGEAMGMAAAPAGSDDRVEKKSYFIHDLFTSVIFADRTLARSSSRVIRKRRAMQLGLSMASLVALVLMGWVLFQSFVGNHEIITNVEAAGLEVRDMEPTKRASVDDLKKLEALRGELAVIDGYRRGTRPIGLSFGMYQGNEMFESGAALYFARLRPLYIAPTGERVQQELEKLVTSLNPNSPSADYQRLLDLWRVYRMMGGELEVQPAQVSTILKKNQRWTGMLAGPDAGEVENLAGEQLEFYAEQLAITDKEADPWALYIKIDSQLSKSAADKLQTAFWNASAYDAIIQYTSERRKPLRLQDLVPQHHEYLELRTEGTADTNLSRLNAFTQEAWEDVKQLIEERAKDLAKLYQELGMAKPEEEIRNEFYDRHRKAHIAVWDLFLEQTYPKPSTFADVKATNEALKIMAGDQSPYRDLVKNVWAKRTLTLAPDNVVAGPDETETKALATSMEALGKFKDAYNLFWTKTGREKGGRVMGHLDNKEPLPAVAQAFIDAARDIPAPFPTRDEMARTAFLRLVDAAFEALRSEARAEVFEFWNEGVLTIWANNFKDRFPFKLQGTSDVSMFNFDRMFSPVTGVLWNTDRRVRAVEAIAFQGGRKLVSLTQEYENTIALARDITEAMYDTEKDASVKVTFAAKLTQTGLLVESLLEVGSDKDGKIETLPYNKYPAQTRDFTWQYWGSNANKMGCRVTAKYTEAKKALPGKDLIDSEWGLLKMMRSPWARGFSVTEKDGMPTYEVLWEFKSPDQQLFFLKGEFTPRKKQNPFQEDLFTKFVLAEAVSK